MPPAKKEETNDFRLYLDEKFNHVHFRLDIIDTKQLEADIAIKELAHIIDSTRIMESNRCVSCENTREIKQIKIFVNEIMFIKKYYKVFALAGVVGFVVMVYSSIQAYSGIKDIVKQEVLQFEEIKETKAAVKVNSGVINNNAEVLREQVKINEEKP